MSEIRYMFTGQAGYEIDCGAHKKIRVVFAMIDTEKTSIGWYLFSSKASAKAQKECDTTNAPDKFGHRADIGRLIPHVFKKDIAIDGLASAKGSFATLTIEVESEKSRLMGYRIAKLKTNAGEVVTFPFGTQRDSTPSRAGEEIEGQVFFLEKGSFDENEFPKGPPGKDSKMKVTGGNL